MSDTIEEIKVVVADIKKCRPEECASAYCLRVVRELAFLYSVSQTYRFLVSEEGIDSIIHLR